MADKELGVSVTGDIDDISSKLDTLANDISQFGDQIIDFSINVDDAQLQAALGEIDGVAEGLNDAASAADALSNSISEIDTTQLDAAKESADGLSDSMTGAGSGADAVSSSGGGGMGMDSAAMEGLGGVAAGIGVASIFDNLTDAAGGYGDSWARVASVMGTSAATVESTWGGAVSQMADTTGRRSSVIREYLIQMGIAGVNSSSVLSSMFTGVSGAAFTTGNSVESITNALRRVVSTGTLGARQLMTMGLSEQDVMKATGLTLDQVNEKMKGMDSTSRAAFMAQIINAKYAGDANENYKNSWQHVTDQLGAAWEMLMRVFGQAILPIVIPATELLTNMIKGLANWFNGLSAENKALLGQVILLGMGLVAFIAIIAMVGGAIALFGMAVAAPIMPLIIVIGLIGLLVILFMRAYNSNENFRKSIDGMWGALSGFGAWLQGGFTSVINGVGAAWNNFTTSLENGVLWFVNLPTRMANWARDSINAFVNGIKQGIKPITDVLDKISKMFPHSPPKEGPLSDITEEGMSSWMGSISGAGIDAIANFNLNNVGIPNMPSVANTTNTNSSNMSITVDMAGVTLGNELDAKNAANIVGGGILERLNVQAANAGVNIINQRR